MVAIKALKMPNNNNENIEWTDTPVYKFFKKIGKRVKDNKFFSFQLILFVITAVITMSFSIYFQQKENGAGWVILYNMLALSALGLDGGFASMILLMLWTGDSFVDWLVDKGKPKYVWRFALINVSIELIIYTIISYFYSDVKYFMLYAMCCFTLNIVLALLYLIFILLKLFFVNIIYKTFVGCRNSFFNNYNEDKEQKEKEKEKKKDPESLEPEIEDSPSDSQVPSDSTSTIS